MGSYHIITVRYLSTVYIILMLIAWKTSTLRGAESFVPSCNISPTQHLIITERETKTITCTGPYQDKINTYFYSPNAQDNLRINIVEASIFDKIRDVNYPISDPTNTSCSNSVNFNWTQDELIRSKLPSLQCVFIFKDGAMSPCITGTISITFAESDVHYTNNGQQSDNIIDGDNSNTSTTHDQTPASMNSSLRLDPVFLHRTSLTLFFITVFVLSWCFYP